MWFVFPHAQVICSLADGSDGGGGGDGDDSALALLNHNFILGASR